jgi:hypothetical protein
MKVDLRLHGLKLLPFPLSAEEGGGTAVKASEYWSIMWSRAYIHRFLTRRASRLLRPDTSGGTKSLVVIRSI